MIDKFRRIAQRVESLRLPAIVIGLSCFTSMVVILVASDSHENDRMLMPSFVGLLWAISLYTFIESFRSVPEKPAENQGLLRGFRHGIRRGWYWIKGVIFLAATAVALAATSRMVSVWLSEYA